MLSLGRRETESIHLHTADGLIVVTVKMIKGNHVKLAIEAPKSVAIIREEIDVLERNASCGGGC